MSEMKLKYYLNNKILLYILEIMLILATVIMAHGQPDTLTPSPYQTIRIEDLENIQFLNSYNYTLYVDGSFAGVYPQNQEIPLIDGSDVVIYIPAPFSTNLDNVYDNQKSLLGMGLTGFFGGFALLVLIILALVYWFFVRKR